MYGSKIEFEATGTNWTIEFEYELEENELKDLAADIVSLTDDFEDNYSRFREDSLLSELSEKKGSFRLPTDAKDLFDLYLNLYKISKGKFTPLAGEVLTKAGYDKTYSFSPKKFSKLPNLDRVLDYEFPVIKIKSPHLLDFGAAGKGHLIDLLGNLLEKRAIVGFSIDAGGDILHRSDNNNKINIGLEHPLDFQKIIGIAAINNKSICGSSGSRRKWEDFHHIIDPDNFQSPKDVLSTWVVADKALLADGLATALFLIDPDKLIDNYNFEYLILYKDLSIKHSEQFPAEFY